MSHEAFDRAVVAYKADPSSASLKTLLIYAVELEPLTPWRNMRARDALVTPFTAIRALCDRQLTSEEIIRFSGCLGYALKATLAGDELSEPQVCYPAAPGLTLTVMEFAWDSTSSTRTQPDYSEAFSKAREYLFAGTPLRTTDREGKGTRDTRLVSGIAPCNVSFFLR